MELIEGNCLDFLEKYRMPIERLSVDCVIASLPFRKNGSSSFAKQASEAWNAEYENFRRLWDCFSWICKKDAPILVFGQEPFASMARLSSKDYRHDLYWEKESGRVEPIGVFWERKPSLNPKAALRPARLLRHGDDVSLMKAVLASHVTEGGTVLDCCMGGGSAGIACLELGLNYIGIEEDHKIFMAAKERLERFEKEMTSPAEEGDVF